MSNLCTMAPNPWILRFAPLVPAGAAVLDLASGGGRHGRLFLERGAKVTFVDRDVSLLADLSGAAEIVPVDLESGSPWPLGGRAFAAVVVVNYLFRPLMPLLLGAVAPGGVLLYETFAQGNERFGRPRNPDFLLRPGELLTAVAGALQVVAYESGIEEGNRVIQRICAVRSADPMPLPFARG